MSHAYARVAARGHPLANADGSAFAHRLILYAKIGPGEHECHFCRRPVSWTVRETSDPRCLTTEHFDGNRRRNDPANLVQCCPPCNSSRAARRRRIARLHSFEQGDLFADVAAR